MKKMNKENITNWEIGDCFITPIKSKDYPQYNDRYLIIICCDYYEYTEKRKPCPLAYLKISNKEVNSEKDIDEAEYIISEAIHMGIRFFPIHGMDTKADIEKKKKVKVYPDEYGFVKEYRVMVFPNKNNKEFIKNCKYMKYENFQRPKEEFFHWQNGLKSYFRGVVLSVEWFFDRIMHWYRLYNLRLLGYYHLPLEEMQQHEDSLLPLVIKYKDFLKEWKEKYYSEDNYKD